MVCMAGLLLHVASCYLYPGAEYFVKYKISVLLLMNFWEVKRLTMPIASGPPHQNFF